MATSRGVVLVAEKDDLVAKVIGAMLAGLGHEPMFARNWVGAVRSAREHDLVAAVLGVRVCSEADGPDTLRALRDARPDLPCVFVCTDPAPHTVPGLEALGRVRVVPKPVGVAALGRALAELLAAT